MYHVRTSSNHVSRVTLAHFIIANIAPFHSIFLQVLQYLSHLFSSIHSLQLERDEYVRDGRRVIAVDKLGRGTRMNNRVKSYKTV